VLFLILLAHDNHYLSLLSDEKLHLQTSVETLFNESWNKRPDEFVEFPALEKL